MSYLAFDRVSRPLHPGEISFLRQIVERVCEACHEPLLGDKAQICAATLVRTYQRGIVDEDILLDIGTAALRS